MTGRRKPEDYYERIGADFDRFMSQYDVAQRVALIRDLWPTDAEGPFLEVGCGTGAVTRGISDLTPGMTVTDISAVLAQQVGEALDLPHCGGDANALPFEDGSFGLVVSSECIEHTPDPARGVAEMLRVCSPGGYVVVTTPNRLWYPVVRGAQLLRIRRFQGNETFLSVKSLVKSAADAGGQVQRISGCHLFPWQLPLAKRVLPTIDRHGDRLYPAMINIGVRIRKVSALEER